MIKHMKNIFLLVIVLALTACGGGGSGSDVTGSKLLAQEDAVVLGGSPSAPAVLSLNSKNIINNNSFNNYFKYVGVAGERLVLRVNLTIPFSVHENFTCLENPGSGATPSRYSSQIHVYNSNNVRVDGVCGEDLTYTFTENGVYIFNFDFSLNDSGFFNAASIKSDTPVKFLEVGSGTPVEPKKMNTNSANSIGNNVFYNYYWISAIKGETIVLSAMLNQPLSSGQNFSCAEQPKTALNSHIYVYNSSLNQVGLTCGEKLRFIVPESGNYIFQFHYGTQSVGVFNAAKI